MTDAAALWRRAELATALLAVDPLGLGGLWLRARSGPVRAAVLDRLPAGPLPCRKLHPTITDTQLFGGVDLSATLATGHVVEDQGLLAQPATIVLTMAERCPAGLAARLGQALDRRSCAVVALDEGADADEHMPLALAERLAFFLCLDGIPTALAGPAPWSATALSDARDRFSQSSVPPEVADTLVRTAAQLGIDSLRAPLFAARAARAHAALMGRMAPDEGDLLAAADLVFAHRATPMQHPQPEDEDDCVSSEKSLDSAETETDPTQADTLPDDVILEAVAAALPPDVLDELTQARDRAPRGSGSGTGHRKRCNRRGRPLPARPGHPDGRARIDIVATLRTAAPWQPVRQAMSPRGHLLHIRPSDIRLRRYEDRSDRLLIFAVDASGSSAMARLAEAKGAVELLLAEAYARRDHVALVAFRGQGADLLLPPTRSLVQTKRRLSALPGGGATPLAAGLRAAHDTAIHAQRHGLTPAVVLLTDGRGNIALDGTPNRPQAAEDATRMAAGLSALGLSSLVVDTANRPQRALQALSEALGGTYLALPRANAERLSAAVSDALDA